MGIGGEDSPDKKNNGATSIESNSPYYLHVSNYPRQMQVNNILTDKATSIGLVNRTIEKPEENEAEYLMWMRCDAMIIGWLTITMEKSIRSNVKYASTSADMWVDLKEQFGKESTPLCPLPSCTYGKCTCDVVKKLTESKEKERLYEFIFGLDDVFSIVRTQILTSKTTPTLGEAYHLVVEDENQRAILATRMMPHDATAFQIISMRKQDASTEVANSINRGMPMATKCTNQEVEHCTIYGKTGTTKLDVSR
ncbi:hypothetical protein Lser_V15G25635 [Lactuca serriola]